MSKFFSDANALSQPGGALANHGVQPPPPPPLGGVTNGPSGGGSSANGGSGANGGLYRSSWNVPLSPSSDDIIPRLQVRDCDWADQCYCPASYTITQTHFV